MTVVLGDLSKYPGGYPISHREIKLHDKVDFPL